MRGPPSRYASVSDSCLWPVYGVIAYREGGPKMRGAPPSPLTVRQWLGTVQGGKCPGLEVYGWEASGWKLSYNLHWLPCLSVSSLILKRH